MHLILIVSARLVVTRPSSTDAMDSTSLPPVYVEANNAARIVGVVGVFHFIAFALVSLRVYVRMFMVRDFGVDDALIVTSCVRT